MKTTLCLCLQLFIFNIDGKLEDEVSVFTIAAEDNHGLERFLRSARVYGIDVHVIWKGEKWTDGDLNYPGGGQQINLMKRELSKLKENNNHIIVYTDSCDVMFLAGIEEIVSKFKAFPDGTRVLFSAETFCRPDKNLASSYPSTDAPYPYVCSGAYIGYLPELNEILNYKKTSNNKDDDQFYLTNIFLDSQLRKKLGIALDNNAVIFQNLNGALSDVQLNALSSEEWPYIMNVDTQHRPLIVHDNGPSKLALNSFGNYLAKSWSVKEGCAVCQEKRIKLKEEALPDVMLAVFIEQATPFLEEFLQQLLDIDYPKDKIHFILHNNVGYHESEVNAFYDAYRREFATAKRIRPSDFMSEAEARNLAKDRCINSVCDYLFSIDSVSRIKKNTLRYLLSSGFDVIAPMLLRYGQTWQTWSNFWSTLNTLLSDDYIDIVYRKIRGIWNVPFIRECYLVKISVFRAKVPKAITYSKENTDSEKAFCASLRDSGIFMYVSNEIYFGHLVNPDSYDVTRTHPDIYQVMDNKIEWEARYLHPEYKASFEKSCTPKNPCPDVYLFPLMSKRFCDELVAIMEAYGRWSDGSNNDKRLEGGYEAVPTRDIHMNQVGLEREWLYILKEYVRPLQEMVFIGYYHNPPVANMNFVVRYHPDEQPLLRPHHDASTYTINLALNNPNVDYEGGGCHFIRYKCSVRNTEKGWFLMHPGRLTHFHEGLPVTNGTRYILISFVQPP